MSLSFSYQNIIAVIHTKSAKALYSFLKYNKKYHGAV